MATACSYAVAARKGMMRTSILTKRKERLQRLINRNSRAGKVIKFVEHFAEPGDAVLQSACRLNLKASSRNARPLHINPDAPRGRGRSVSEVTIVADRARSSAIVARKAIVNIGGRDGGLTDGNAKLVQF